MDIKNSVSNMKRILVTLLLAITLAVGCKKTDPLQPQENLIEYYTLYEVSGQPATGNLTLFFGPGYSQENFTASVTSMPSTGTWSSDKNVLTLGAERYRVDRNEAGQFWCHRGQVYYKFTFDGNNLQR